jgi:hypothetical protein
LCGPPFVIEINPERNQMSDILVGALAVCLALQTIGYGALITTQAAQIKRMRELTGAINRLRRERPATGDASAATGTAGDPT